MQEYDKPDTDTTPTKTENKSLEDIIRDAEFPEDYDAFDDGILDMIP